MSQATGLELLAALGGPGDSGPPEAEQGCALGYCRVSTEDQIDGNSLAAQEENIGRYADAEGILILEIYRDEGVSAFSDADRPAFETMLTRAKTDQRVRYILVDETSRFYRDRYRAAAVKADLRAAGVSVIPVRTPYDPATIGGMWQEAIFETQAQAYSMEVRDHVIKNMRHNVTQRDPETGWCYKNGGWALWGYRSERLERGRDRRGKLRYKQIWVRNEEVVAGQPVWQWARHVLVELRGHRGWSLERIRDFLNDHGVPPQRGKDWNTSSIHELLTPQMLLQYAGYYFWNKQGARKSGLGYKPRDQWVQVDNAHEPIITVEEAEVITSVGARRRSANTPPRSTRSEFLLSGGPFICGRCGHRMHGFTTNGKRDRYYICGEAYRRGRTCLRPGERARYVPATVLENAIFDLVRDYLVGDATIDAIVESANKRVDTLNRDDPQLREVRARLRKLEQQIERLVESIKGGIDASLVAPEAERLKAERDRLLKQAEATPESGQKTPHVTREQVAQYLATLASNAKSAPVEERRELLRLFVKGLSWHPDERKVIAQVYSAQDAFGHRLHWWRKLTCHRNVLWVGRGSRFRC